MMFKKINDLYALRKWVLLFFVVVFILSSCNKKVKDASHTKKKQSNDTTAEYVDSTIVDDDENAITVKREKYVEYISWFLDQNPNNQSLDSLNIKVEDAMDVFASDNSIKDENFREVTEELVEYVTSLNTLKIPDSFYTAGLLESYGYFSDANGHAINNFKDGAKLGSLKCVKYLAIIYYERLLYKHSYQDYCDPVCMFHRGRNYIEESEYASLNKNEILSFSKLSNNFLMKIITDHLNKNMSDDEIFNYVLNLRTSQSPILNINNVNFNLAFSNQNAAPDVLYSNEQMAIFEKLLKQNKNIQNSDIARLYTFHFPAYENENKFIFWIKQDINQKNIKTFDEFTTVYDLDSIYQYTDFLIDERRKDFLNFFAAKENQK